MTFSLKWNRLKAGRIEDLDQVLSHLERELDKLRDLHQVRFTDVITSDYRAKAGDFILVDPSGGAFNIFFPPAKLNPNTLITVRRLTSSTNSVLLHAFPGETLDFSSGVTSISLATGFARRDFLALRPPHSCFNRVD